MNGEEFRLSGVGSSDSEITLEFEVIHSSYTFKLEINYFNSTGKDGEPAPGVGGGFNWSKGELGKCTHVLNNGVSTTVKMD